MNRNQKNKNKTIWYAVVLVLAMSLAFCSATCSNSSAAQQPEQVYTCFAESVSAIAAGISENRDQAIREALERCQSLSPTNQTCRLTRCSPR